MLYSVQKNMANFFLKNKNKNQDRLNHARLYAWSGYTSIVINIELELKLYQLVFRLLWEGSFSVVELFNYAQGVFYVPTT